MMGMKKCSVLIGLFLVGLILVGPAESRSPKTKPATEYFNLCRRNDPMINKCIKQNIIDLKPRLIKGIPELRLVPLDPMNIPRMSLTEGENNFRFRQTMTNLTIRGLGEYTVKSLESKMSAKDVEMKIVLSVPVLNMTSMYEMEGQILVLPIRGEGDCTLDFVDVTTTADVTGHVVTRSGEDYLDIQQVKWDIKVGGAKSHFNNLFNGDKTLGDATNNFLNSNWKDAFATYKHLPEEAFGLVYKDLISQVFKKYTMKELFLE